MIDHLTAEERAIVALVAQGYRDGWIARELGLGSVHVTHAIQRLYAALDLFDDPDGERLPRVRLAALWGRYGTAGDA